MVHNHTTNVDLIDICTEQLSYFDDPRKSSEISNNSFNHQPEFIKFNRISNNENIAAFRSSIILNAHLSRSTFLPTGSLIGFAIIFVVAIVIIILMRTDIYADNIDEAYIENLNMCIGILEMVLGFIMDVALHRLNDAVAVLEVGRKFCMEQERLNATLSPADAQKKHRPTSSSTQTKIFRFMSFAVLVISPITFLGPGALSFQPVHKLFDGASSTITPLTHSNILDSTNSSNEGCFELEGAFNSGRLSAYISDFGNKARLRKITTLRCASFIRGKLNTANVKLDRKCNIKHPLETMLQNAHFEYILGLPDLMLVETRPSFSRFIKTTSPSMKRSLGYNIPYSLELAVQVLSEIAILQSPTNVDNSQLSEYLMSDLNYISFPENLTTLDNPLLDNLLDRSRVWGDVTIFNNPVHYKNQLTAASGELLIEKYTSEIEFSVQFNSTIHNFETAYSCDSINCLSFEPQIAEKISYESFCGEFDELVGQFLTKNEKRAMSSSTNKTQDIRNQRKAILEALVIEYGRDENSISNQRICVGFGFRPDYSKNSSIRIAQNNPLSDVSAEFHFVAEVIVTTARSASGKDVLIFREENDPVSASVLSAKAKGVRFQSIGVVRNLPNIAAHNLSTNLSHCSRTLPFFVENIQQVVNSFKSLSVADTLWDFMSQRVLKDSENRDVTAFKSFNWAVKGKIVTGFRLSANSIFMMVSVSCMVLLLCGVIVLWKQYCLQVLDFLNVQDLAMIAPGWLLTREVIECNRDSSRRSTVGSDTTSPQTDNRYISL